MYQLSPMYPINRQQLGTFKKQPQPYGRFFLACITATLLLGLFGGVALCATRLSEIERIHAAAARI